MIVKYQKHLVSKNLDVVGDLGERLNKENA